MIPEKYRNYILKVLEGGEVSPPREVVRGKGVEPRILSRLYQKNLYYAIPNFKELRTASKLTQKEIAHMSKVSLRTVQRLEKGEYIKIENYHKIMDTLRKRLIELGYEIKPVMEEVEMVSKTPKREKTKKKMKESEEDIKTIEELVEATLGNDMTHNMTHIHATPNDNMTHPIEGEEGENQVNTNISANNVSYDTRHYNMTHQTAKYDTLPSNNMTHTATITKEDVILFSEIVEGKNMTDDTYDTPNNMTRQNNNTQNNNIIYPEKHYSVSLDNKYILEKIILSKILLEREKEYLYLLDRENLDKNNAKLYDTVKEILESDKVSSETVINFSSLLDECQRTIEKYSANNLELSKLIETYKDNLLKEKTRNILREMLNKDEIDIIKLQEIISEYAEKRTDDKAKISSYVSKFYEEYLNSKDEIYCNIQAIDEVINGFRKGQYVIVASRPSVGKTTILLNLAYNFAKEGKKVVIFTLEQSVYELIHRLVNIAAGKKVTQEAEIAYYLNELENYNIFIYENIYSLNEMYITLLKYHRDADVVLVDYAQLFMLQNKYTNIVHEYSVISNSLRRIAKDLNVLLIVASQLNREVERRADPKPRLSDIRESGAFEQDADIVILLHKQNIAKDKAKLFFNIAKNRNGRTEEIELIFDLPAFKIYNN